MYGFPIQIIRLQIRALLFYDEYLHAQFQDIIEFGYRKFRKSPHTQLQTIFVFRTKSINDHTSPPSAYPVSVVQASFPSQWFLRSTNAAIAINATAAMIVTMYFMVSPSSREGSDLSISSPILSMSNRTE